MTLHPLQQAEYNGRTYKQGHQGPSRYGKIRSHRSSYCDGIVIQIICVVTQGEARTPPLSPPNKYNNKYLPHTASSMRPVRIQTKENTAWLRRTYRTMSSPENRIRPRLIPENIHPSSAKNSKPHALLK